jgi:hypothetical protein
MLLRHHGPESWRESRQRPAQCCATATPNPTSFSDRGGRTTHTLGRFEQSRRRPMTGRWCVVVQERARAVFHVRAGLDGTEPQASAGRGPAPQAARGRPESLYGGGRALTWEGWPGLAWRSAARGVAGGGVQGLCVDTLPPKYHCEGWPAMDVQAPIATTSAAYQRRRGLWCLIEYHRP